MSNAIGVLSKLFRFQYYFQRRNKTYTRLENVSRVQDTNGRAH